MALLQTLARTSKQLEKEGQYETICNAKNTYALGWDSGGDSGMATV